MYRIIIIIIIKENILIQFKEKIITIKKKFKNSQLQKVIKMNKIINIKTKINKYKKVL